jgi:hypothetical protein
MARMPSMSIRGRPDVPRTRMVRVLVADVDHVFVKAMRWGCVVDA